MNLIATAAIIAALLTGSSSVGGVTSRDLAAPGDSSTLRVAQNEREVTPAPLLATQESSQRIAAFWIILPN